MPRGPKEALNDLALAEPRSSIEVEAHTDVMTVFLLTSPERELRFLQYVRGQGLCLRSGLGSENP